MYDIVYTKKAVKDIPKLKSAGLADKTRNLIKLLKDNPYQNPPLYEKLLGDFAGAYSRRINIKHRLVYQVLESEKKVKLISMWTHYKF